jgi:hypothetical protein
MVFSTTYPRSFFALFFLNLQHLKIHPVDKKKKIIQYIFIGHLLNWVLGLRLHIGIKLPLKCLPLLQTEKLVQLVPLGLDFRVLFSSQTHSSQILEFFHIWHCLRAGSLSSSSYSPLPTTELTAGGDLSRSSVHPKDSLSLLQVCLISPFREC